MEVGLKGLGVGTVIGLRDGSGVKPGVGLDVDKGVGARVGPGVGTSVGECVGRITKKFCPVIFSPPVKET